MRLFVYLLGIAVTSILTGLVVGLTVLWVFFRLAELL